MGRTWAWSLFLSLILLPAVALADDEDSFSCAKQNPSHDNPIFAQLRTQMTAVQSINTQNSAHCQVRADFDTAPKDLARGARQVMAMMYGNCTVLSLPATNSTFAPYDNSVSDKTHRTGSHLRHVSTSLSSLADSHYYLQWAKDPDSKPEGCSNVNFTSIKRDSPTCGQISCLAVKYPPLYQFGSAANGYNLYHLASNGRTRSNTQGIDCSAFVSMAAWVQGFRFYPEGSTEKYAKTTRFTTAVMRDMGYGKDCFKRPREGETLKPGDLLVSPTHVVSIDTVGEDPFGIEANLRNFTPPLLGSDTTSSRLQIIATETCNGWMTDPSTFKITIINSSNAGNIGIQRQKLIPGIEASYIPGTQKVGNGIWKTFLLKQAQASCEDRVFEFLAKSISYPYGAPVRTEEASTGDSGITLLRHQSERSECRVPKDEMPPIPGLDCVQCCSTEASYDAVMPESTEGQAI